MTIKESKYWNRAWSLVHGCTSVSEACLNCWLREYYKRFKMDFDNVSACEANTEIPIKTKKPTTWAVWSDIAHSSVSRAFIEYVFEVMAACPRHTFLVLTKRPDRLNDALYGGWTSLLGGGDYYPNVWLGTTIEKGIYAERIDFLKRSYPFNLFLSVEPMLGPLPELHLTDDLEHIKLVICGCESGRNRRNTDINWIRDLRDQCIQNNTMFYLKQMDIDGRIVHLPELDGVVYDKLPWRV